MKRLILFAFLAACHPAAKPSTPDLSPAPDVDLAEVADLAEATDASETADASDVDGGTPDLTQAPDLDTPCGNTGQRCCYGATCNGADRCMHDNVPTGYCTAETSCGTLGYHCCDGYLCSGGTYCHPSGGVLPTCQ